MTSDLDHPSDAAQPALPRRRMLAALGAGAAALAGADLAFGQAPAPGRRRGPSDLSDEQLGWDAKRGQYVLPDLP